MAQVQICRHFGDKDFEALTKRLIADSNGPCSEKHWQRAVDVFERRMRERFFLCIEKLERVETWPYVEIPDAPDPDRALPEKVTTTTGFAIMALCCLLIDTLQFFRAGASPSSPPLRCPRPEKCENPKSGTNQAFIDFLTQSLSFDPDVAKDFAKGIRNGIVHNAETRGWVIRLDKPENKIVEHGTRPYSLNRTLFCKALEDWFKNYLDRLRYPSDPNETELRKHFIKGMKHVVDRCRKL